MCSISIVEVYCMITIPGVFQASIIVISSASATQSPSSSSVVSAFTRFKASWSLLYKIDSLLKYRAINFDRPPATLLWQIWALMLLHTSAALAFFPVSSIAFQKDSLQISFHILSEAGSSPRSFQMLGGSYKLDDQQQLRNLVLFLCVGNYLRHLRRYQHVFFFFSELCHKGFFSPGEKGTFLHPGVFIVSHTTGKFL